MGEVGKGKLSKTKAALFTSKTTLHEWASSGAILLNFGAVMKTRCLTGMGGSDSVQDWLKVPDQIIF